MAEKQLDCSNYRGGKVVVNWNRKMVPMAEDGLDRSRQMTCLAVHGIRAGTSKMDLETAFPGFVSVTIARRGGTAFLQFRDREEARREFKGGRGVGRESSKFIQNTSICKDVLFKYNLGFQKIRMCEVLEEDLATAIKHVLENIEGISELYPLQIKLLSSLVKQENVFFTASTNAGKTLPAVIFPQIVQELNKLGYGLSSGKVLFVTPLNSIQMSMRSSLEVLGIECAAVNSENYEKVLASEVSVIFISPEMMKMSCISKCLLSHRKDFLLKVIDECHLGRLIWIFF